jgi:hypothetical protein
MKPGFYHSDERECQGESNAGGVGFVYPENCHWQEF